MTMKQGLGILGLSLLSGLAIGLSAHANQPRHFIGVHCGVTQVTRYEARIDDLSDCEIIANVNAPLQ